MSLNTKKSLQLHDYYICKISQKQLFVSFPLSPLKWWFVCLMLIAGLERVAADSHRVFLSVAGKQFHSVRSTKGCGGRCCWFWLSATKAFATAACGANDTHFLLRVGANEVSIYLHGARMLLPFASGCPWSKYISACERECISETSSSPAHESFFADLHLLAQYYSRVLLCMACGLLTYVSNYANVLWARHRKPPCTF